MDHNEVMNTLRLVEQHPVITVKEIVNCVNLKPDRVRYSLGILLFGDYVQKVCKRDSLHACEVKYYRTTKDAGPLKGSLPHN